VRWLPLFPLLVALAGAAYADDNRVPEPLDLGSALDLAADHPRATSAALVDAPARRQPLYLDCHSLAFGNTAGIDPARNRSDDRLVSPLAGQQLEVLQRYFDVLLADLSFARYSEATAVAYVQFDRARTRQQLGQASELRVAELNGVFLDVRRQQSASEASQRLTRSLLAQAINHPDQLPSELVKVAAAPAAAAPPEPKAIIAAALRDNAWLTAKRDAANNTDRRLMDIELGEQVLELVLRLTVLQDVERYALADTEFRDLRLEQSRVLYDQELHADLGYSMSQQTRSRLRERRVAFCRMLANAELNALQGKSVWPHQPKHGTQ
jgi:hypothetical protein